MLRRTAEGDVGADLLVEGSEARVGRRCRLVGAIKGARGRRFATIAI